MDTQNFIPAGNEPSGTPLSLWQRIAGVLWGGPRAAFDNIIASPRPAGIMALLLALNLLLTLAILPKIKEFALWTIQHTPDMPAEAMGIAAAGAVVVALVTALLGPLVMWLIIAGLLKLFNAFSGEKAPFKAIVAVAVYSGLPVMLGSIVKTVLIMATPAQNMAGVTTSLALLLSGEENGRLYMTLSQVDPFFIWSLGLLVLGASAAMKVPVKKVGVYLGVIWILYVLGMGLLSPLGKMAASGA